MQHVMLLSDMKAEGGFDGSLKAHEMPAGSSQLASFLMLGQGQRSLGYMHLHAIVKHGHLEQHETCVQTLRIASQLLWLHDYSSSCDHVTAAGCISRIL